MITPEVETCIAGHERQHAQQRRKAFIIREVGSHKHRRYHHDEWQAKGPRNGFHANGT